MERQQKIAFARILADLIEADFIVEQGEMDYFEEIISRNKLNIKKTMLSEAKRLTLAKAIKTLKELDNNDMEEAIDLLKGLSLSDGTCVPLEAIQILSIILSLKSGAEVLSVKSGDLQIENMTAIYIENEKNTSTNNFIENNYREINNEFAIAGFKFVHIPHIARDFDSMDRDYLKKVVSYMIPSASDNRIESICSDLCSISTSRFCRDLLYKKIGINLLGAKPSLLFKINNSSVVAQHSGDDSERIIYSNFLLIDLGEDILKTIRKLVDTYSNMVNCAIAVESQPQKRKFLYYGFHRSLFDLISYGKEKKEYRLVIDLKYRERPIMFESLDGQDKITIKLSAQEYALYILIVQESVFSNGLDWREQIDKEVKKTLVKRFNEIYEKTGKGKKAVDYKDRTQAHHIREKIKALEKMANRDMFIPENIKEGKGSVYKIQAPPDFIDIRN